METKAENLNHWENRPNLGKSTGLWNKNCNCFCLDWLECRTKIHPQSFGCSIKGITSNRTIDCLADSLLYGTCIYIGSFLGCRSIERLFRDKPRRSWLCCNYCGLNQGRYCIRHGFTDHALYDHALVWSHFVAFCGQSIFLNLKISKAPKIVLDWNYYWPVLLSSLFIHNLFIHEFFPSKR